MVGRANNHAERGAGGAAAEELVVLVDDVGTPVGTAPKATVHSADTPLHLAFSNYLQNGAGEVLLTRRALGKKTWPGVWTNSYCGHPGPGEPTTDAIRRRGAEELGLDPADLEDIAAVLPEFRYRATDSSGIVEYEICPVYVSRLRAGAEIAPHPEEVDSFFWLPPERLTAAVDAAPLAFSPWLVEELGDERLRRALGA